MNNLNAVVNRAVADLAVIGYVVADDNVLKIKAINEKSVLVAGFDEEEEFWYVDSMSGNVESGFIFDYKAVMFESKDEALEYFDAK